LLPAFIAVLPALPAEIVLMGFPARHIASPLFTVCDLGRALAALGTKSFMHMRLTTSRYLASIGSTYHDLLR